MHLGQELKAWMRRDGPRRIKVATLAKIVGISQSTLYAYLAGTTVPPSEVLDDLLSHLAVPMTERRRLHELRDALQSRTPVMSPKPVAEPYELPVVRQPHVPRELPADIGGFVGREVEQAALHKMLDAKGQQRLMPVIVLSGIAGIGKTALAIRLGHRAEARFPDGTLYVDLLGFSPGEPRTPANVLAGFLRSLGVSEANIPAELAERAARFRTLLAGRRMLVVLDNALNAEQVRPLLPGEPGCCVVVTSRNELIGLQVRHGAHVVPLEPLSGDESTALLLAEVSSQAHRAFHAAARVLAAHCSGLPLALRIVSAQILNDRRRPVGEVMTEIVEELDHGPSLDLLEGGEGASVRAVFTWSEERLPAGANRVFWLLAHHPLEDLDLLGVAALLGVSRRAARKHVDLLTQVHLVHLTRSGRVRMHDLLRQHARERAQARLAPFDRDAATTRLLRYLVEAAQSAMLILQPTAEHLADHASERAGAALLPGLGSPEQAQEWLVAEWDNLLRAIAYTSRAGWTDLTGNIATVMRVHLDEGGRHHDALTVLGHALDVSQSSTNPIAEAAALRDLGAAFLRLGRYDEARAHYHRGMQVSIKCGDLNGHAGALNNLGNLHERLGDYAAALVHYQDALGIVGQLNFPMGEATLLNNIGFTHLRLGNLDAALERCERSWAVFEGIGDWGGMARAGGNIGQIHLQLADAPSAMRSLEEALEQARQIGAAGIETEVLNSVGETWLAMGDQSRSLDHHQQALSIARGSGDRYEQARALEGEGRALQASGADELAAASWREAHLIYAELGVPEALRVVALASGVDTRFTELPVFKAVT